MKSDIIENQSFDTERALYALRNAQIKNCIFGGEADGESPLKESENTDISECVFSLRYPMWHTKNFLLSHSEMKDTCRAALWYAQKGEIRECRLHGIKCLRECKDISVDDCDIKSPEFGWKCRNTEIKNSDIVSEYFLLDSKKGNIENIRLTGKYSFQYTEDFTVSRSFLKTKDAFWHSKNVTVKDSVLEGEYLGWYSENLTLINCTVKGTQPLCYCKGLRLIGCKTEDTDLSFEYSQVDAEIFGNIQSVKNPLSGRIRADSIGEIISDGSVKECKCEIIISNQ